MTRKEAETFCRLNMDSRAHDKILMHCIDEQYNMLDKIRAEIEQIIGERNLDDYDFCSGLICARNIIDKYKSESEDE